MRRTITCAEETYKNKEIEKRHVKETTEKLDGNRACVHTIRTQQESRVCHLARQDRVCQIQCISDSSMNPVLVA